MDNKSETTLVTTTGDELSSLEAMEAYEFAALADAPNTQRAYKADWKHFVTWCANRKRCPLPVEPDVLATYTRFCAEKLKLKMSTVSRRLSAISEAHLRSGLKSPTQEWVVRNTMKRLRREHGTPPKGKEPLLVEDLKKIVELCDTTTLSGIRDKAVLLVGFGSSLRRSDISNLDFEDISKAEEGLVLMIRKEKTDQKRLGRKVGLPYGKYPETCAIRALCHWIEASQLRSGPLFRAVTKFDKPRQTRMSSGTVATIVKKYCDLIGKSPRNMSGHSLRSGFATSAAMAGASERSIQNQTGHASVEVLRRYIREAEIFRDNALKTLDL